MKNKINRFMSFIDKAQVYHLVIVAPLLNITVEILTRRSFSLAFSYIIHTPHLFMLNVLMMFATLVLAYFLPRRSFFVSVVFLTWLGLAIANFFLIGYRSVPIAPVDFINLVRMFAIIKIYLTTFQIILALTAIFGVIAVLIVVWQLSPKESFVLKRAVSGILAFVLAIGCVLALPIASSALPQDSLNLAEAYEAYGFVYCFISGFVSNGIDKPEGYSKQAADDVLAQIGAQSTNTPDKLPNIIFLQLESFFDANRIDGLILSSDPTPFFNQLKTQYPSGFISVPTIGAGTANTEFEVITGMDIDFFGMGEYPYNTVISQQTCESLGYNLMELGYATTAIHNYSATFYARHEIFANLGFERFVSVEYMQNVAKNELGWAKDSILTGEIMSTLRATENNDFVYAISVQGHGRYPDDLTITSPAITVEGFTDDALIGKYEYYVNQMYECDQFLAQLLAELEKYGEDTVVVIFGDHLPSLSITEEQLLSGDRFQTEYVIWSNLDLQAQNRDLEAYEIGAFTLGLLDINNGNLTKLHQSQLELTARYEALHILQYDMLYGEKYIYNGEDYYKPTMIKLGRDNIKISSADLVGDTLYVFGSGFTESSVIFVDGNKAETQYINTSTLTIKNPKNASYIFVAQLSDADHSILSKTDSYIP